MAEFKIRRDGGVKIDSAFLSKVGACPGYRKLFRRRFPKGVVFYRDSAITLGKQRIFIQRSDWFVNHMMSPQGLQKYRECLDKMKACNSYFETTSPVDHIALNADIVRMLRWDLALRIFFNDHRYRRYFP